MQFSFILASVAVSLFLPWVLSKAFTEKGTFKDGKIICKSSIVLRILFLLGALLFFFILLMCYLTEEEMDIISYIFYPIAFLFMVIFLIISYIFTRYKIICDINKQEIIIYRLFAPKKRIPFSCIYSQERNREITTVKDRNNKVLFVFPSTVLFLGSGYYALNSCLCAAIKSNQNQEPIDMKEINRLLDNDVSLGLIKKK